MQERIRRTARLAQKGEAPKPEDYVQIYSEHPNCSGGVETLKLFMPYGVRDFLTGKPPGDSSGFSYEEILESLVRSGFWFWPEELKAPLRLISQRLFWDWFESGSFSWPAPDYQKDDHLGPGDDILTLATLCQIDPYALVEALSTLHTPQADDVCASVLTFSADACVYVAADLSDDAAPYQSASKAIATTLRAREAQGFLDVITPDWLDDAYFRNAETYPRLAKSISDFALYFDSHSISRQTAAQQPCLVTWPDLPTI
ncbi:hypothetical protein ACMA5I_04405 [Paracoccaceae bacterium GXU_MW_L88]